MPTDRELNHEAIETHFEAESPKREVAKSEWGPGRWKESVEESLEESLEESSRKVRSEEEEGMLQAKLAHIQAKLDALSVDVHVQLAKTKNSIEMTQQLQQHPLPQHPLPQQHPLPPPPQRSPHERSLPPEECGSSPSPHQPSKPPNVEPLHRADSPRREKTAATEKTFNGEEDENLDDLISNLVSLHLAAAQPSPALPPEAVVAPREGGALEGGGLEGGGLEGGDPLLIMLNERIARCKRALGQHLVV